MQLPGHSSGSSPCHCPRMFANDHSHNCGSENGRLAAGAEITERVENSQFESDYATADMV